MTFNEAAARELKERLTAAGVNGVAARTFHSVGNQIIRARFFHRAHYSTTSRT